MKLHTKLSADSFVSLGLLSDVSENGLFIKSNRDFTMGDAIDIEVFMPDNNNALLKGVIRRKIELPDSHRKYRVRNRSYRKRSGIPALPKKHKGANKNTSSETIRNRR